MLGRLPSFLTVRLLAALLLAAIGLQAGESFEASARPVSGSAFSAATFEVALAPRRSDQSKMTVAALPFQPPAIVIRAAPRRAVVAPQVVRRPDSTGPPLRLVLTRPAAPRAPPLA